MNLRQLRYFTKTVEAGNITRAAEQLFIAQPGLGLQIRQLEEALGVPLLHRHSRGVTPTAAGQILYDRACEILRLVEDTQREVKTVSSPLRENISLGLTNGVTNLLGVTLMLSAREELPSVHLLLVEGQTLNLVEALEREEIDFAVTYDVAERPGLLRVPLMEDELLLVSAPRASLAESVAFGELAQEELVLGGERDALRRLVQLTADKLNVPLRISFEASSVAAIRSLLFREQVATIMAFGSAAEDIQAGRLVGRRIVSPSLRRTLFLARLIRRPLFLNEGALIDLLGRAMSGMVEAMGTLATPLPSLSAPLSRTVDQMALPEADRDAP
ncbi:LysR family transcriptional regulator [Teichococcus oryzae]|jgi:LysR family nitrogen assimilation transcriptional regulator|uniref:LysR family transcriptional regulator n=1 Tax=Teichococcus oryzae TaxID=1608942 RepID=A0A5B2TBY5_9PROT|nr:LysR substrate-binding domain-containing protein [Pseudoroseomonas oryzae]KAA2211574.1 LysR family transcriptional regulator [Pseudoroseomonas oryzae]